MIRRLILLLASVACVASAAPQELALSAPIDHWDEAIPLGNGLLGGLPWGSGNEIRLSLYRGDLWDLRPHPAIVRPGFNYAKVVELATAGRTDELNKEFSRVSDFPAKLPGSRLVLTWIRSIRHANSAWTCAAPLAPSSLERRAECFFTAKDPVALMFVPGATRLRLLANDAVKTLGYQPAVAGGDARTTRLTQDAALGFRYVILASSRAVPGGTLVAIALTTNRDAADPLALAQQRTATALDAGYETAFARHTAWWKTFWGKSSVTAPDEKIQQHYNLVRYYYGAASRGGAPPMPLQGVWTADEGKLPSWHGDYHHDLNTQLPYWVYPAMGHFEEGRSLLDFMWGLKPRHEQFAPEFFGLRQDLVVPGVMSLDGSAMGAWFPYTLSPPWGHGFRRRSFGTGASRWIAIF